MTIWRSLADNRCVVERIAQVIANCLSEYDGRHIESGQEKGHVLPGAAFFKLLQALESAFKSPESLPLFPD